MSDKTFFFILTAIFLLFSKESKGQNALSLGIISDLTVAGSLAGGYVGYVYRQKLEMGAFYETRTNRFESQFNQNLDLVGGYFLYDLISDERLSLGLMLRGGLERDRFIVLVPSLLLEYKFSKSFNLFGLAGLRYLKPSIGIGLHYHLFH